MPIRRASFLESTTRLAPVSTSIRRRVPLTIGSSKKCPCESAAGVTEDGADGGAGRPEPLFVLVRIRWLSPRDAVRRSVFSSAPLAARAQSSLGPGLSTTRENRKQISRASIGPPPQQPIASIVAERSSVG
jgi:hypothetical protein